MQIRRLTLDRFRCFEHFTWHPEPGINCVIGAGDGGKTTLLEAIGRGTSPAPASTAAEHDYFCRRTEDGFELEFILGGLGEPLLGTFRVPALWGWQGSEKPLLDAPVAESEAVLRLLVRGTPDMEVEHRLMAPNGEELSFSADKRRLLGLCRVGEMRGSSREFRMARGSLLERTLGREDVRGAAARAVREASSQMDLPTDVSAQLETLERLLQREGITSGKVTLEVLSPPGQSLLGLLGVALGERGEAISLAYSGQGAQRLASYLLATELAEAPALLVLDEAEFGLEPYRQRSLIQRLRRLLGADGQAFLTTHSPAVLAELQVEELQRLHIAANGERDVSPLGPALTRIKDRDPEALLCRLPVVCEGRTEVELLHGLLEGIAAADDFDLGGHGIRFVDGGGQPNAFEVIAALRSVEFPIGAFLDQEVDHSGRRERLKADAQVVCGSFSDAACTEMALALGLNEGLLDELLQVSDGHHPQVGRSRRQQLSEVLQEAGERAPSELAQTHGWPTVRTALGETAHKQGWFKAGGNSRALAAWLGDGRLPPGMLAELQGFYARLKDLALAHAHQTRVDAQPNR